MRGIHFREWDCHVQRPWDRNVLGSLRYQENPSVLSVWEEVGELEGRLAQGHIQLNRACALPLCPPLCPPLQCCATANPPLPAPSVPLHVHKTPKCTGSGIHSLSLLDIFVYALPTTVFFFKLTFVFWAMPTFQSHEKAQRDLNPGFKVLLVLQTCFSCQWAIGEHRRREWKLKGHYFPGSAAQVECCISEVKSKW